MNSKLQIIALALLCGLLGALIPQRADAGAYVPSRQPWTLLSKASDDSRSSTTTYASDSTLQFAVSASTAYEFRGRLAFAMGDAGDYKTQWTFPASSARMMVHYTVAGDIGNLGPLAVGLSSGPSSPTTWVTQDASGGGTWIATIDYCGTYVCGATPGTFALQWAQVGSSSTGTVLLRGSSLEYRAVQ